MLTEELSNSHVESGSAERGGVGVTVNCLQGYECQRCSAFSRTNTSFWHESPNQGYTCPGSDMPLREVRIDFQIPNGIALSLRGSRIVQDEGGQKYLEGKFEDLSAQITGRTVYSEGVMEKNDNESYSSSLDLDSLLQLIRQVWG